MSEKKKEVRGKKTEKGEDSPIELWNQPHKEKNQKPKTNKQKTNRLGGEAEAERSPRKMYGGGGGGWSS